MMSERDQLLARLDQAIRREQEQQIRDLAVHTIYSYNQIVEILRDWLENVLPYLGRSSHPQPSSTGTTPGPAASHRPSSITCQDQPEYGSQPTAPPTGTANEPGVGTKSGASANSRKPTTSPCRPAPTHGTTRNAATSCGTVSTPPSASPSGTKHSLTPAPNRKHYSQPQENQHEFCTYPHNKTIILVIPRRRHNEP